MKVDTETEWTPVTRQRRLRSKTLDPGVVEETKRLRSTAPTQDNGDSTKMVLTDEETRKRALVESTSDDDDEPAEKYWLGASGELDKQAAAEATEKALDSLLAHGVVEDNET